ncbi:SLC5 family protein [Hymenobacter terrenus]|uniref:SLC5 family protein n=1 Tax=Hymenobacter terrenus TaxID=1629124 RepID=UPI000619128F|nr:sodium/solute symporter [Hymenobacter terrenus]
MLTSLTTFDIVVLLFFIALMPLAGLLFSKQSSSEDYFLAGRSLRWWQVAGSIFGTNVNSFHLIGMLGIGFSVGLAQSHYELLAPVGALLLCYAFLPVYRRLRIFTLSQYLEYRYSSSARLLYTILMITLIVVQLVAGFYIGGRTLRFLLLGTPLEITYIQGIVLMALVTCSYTMFGGLSSIVATDNLQSIMMLAAGLLVAGLTFAQPEIGGLKGLLALDASLPTAAQKLHLYLPTQHPDLPWSGVFSGLLVLHVFYYCNNQYLVQRTLAATTDNEAKLGIVAASFLKLLIPFFSVACGVAAAHLFRLRFGSLHHVLPDDAFLQLIATVVPTGYGLMGFILAGLCVATFSSIDSMMNGATTLVSIDVYKKYVNPEATDGQLIKVGRVTIGIVVVVTACLAIFTYDPTSTGNFFLSVSNRGSYFTQGIVVAFLLGIWWRRASTAGALAALVAAPLFAFGFEALYNNHLGSIASVAALFGTKLNFMHRVFLTTVFTLLMHRTVSLLRPDKAGPVNPDTLAPALPWRYVLVFLVLQAGLVGMVRAAVLPSIVAGLLSGTATLGLFWWGLRGYRTGPLWQDNRFYAGVLCGVVVALLYSMP